jgi:two-component system chemotaxis response regulator CheY
MHTGIIVDDAAVMRLRLKEILESRYKITGEASNGEEALSCYDKNKPDFVTLDITMPKMNGFQVIESILGKYPDAKIVIVSAVGQKQMVFKALNMGAKDFIIKPFETERVLQAIDRLFE